MDHQNQNAGKPTPDRIMQFMWGYAPTLLIGAALEHGLFDYLAASPRSIVELEGLTGMSARGLKGLLNGLVGLQLAARAGDRYSLTEESSLFLVSGKPSCLGAILRHTSHQLLPNWLQLSECARTGKPATSVNQSGHGAEFFAQFVEALFPMSFPATQVLAAHLRLGASSGEIGLLDIGAGSGVWGIGLALNAPQAKIRAVDWPNVLEVTRKVAAVHGVADRLVTSPGDLLEADFGGGHQIATIGHILHSEGVDRSRRLLARTFEALAPGGVVAIMEFLCNDERTGPPASLFFALNMLVHTDEGDAFTFPEISGWLREAGFVNPRLLDVPGPSPLILANKP